MYLYLILYNSPSLFIAFSVPLFFLSFFLLFFINFLFTYSFLSSFLLLLFLLIIYLFIYFSLPCRPLPFLFFRPKL
jgi:hypothetical protein